MANRERVHNSGDPDRCDGPKQYLFHKQFPWKGCPRLSLTGRAAYWFRLHDLAGGKMSYQDALRSSQLLQDAFQVVDFADAMRKREVEERELAHRDTVAYGRPKR